LVHPASFTKNNPYKTLNVLINAWAIGAVPVLANQPPYENVERDGLGLLCEPDESDSWYEKLKIAISQPARAKQIRENLDAFLRREYSGRKNEEVIEKILSELPVLGFATIQNRYQTLLMSDTSKTIVQNNIIDHTSTLVLIDIVLFRIKRKIRLALMKIFERLKLRLRLC
jgi:hypothetical protein